MSMYHTTLQATPGQLVFGKDNGFFRFRTWQQLVIYQKQKQQ
jgi:hypothetical protein